MQKRSRMRWALTVAALALGIGLMAVGLHKGQFHKVRQKAAAVCLECVGIG